MLSNARPIRCQLNEYLLFKLSPFSYGMLLSKQFTSLSHNGPRVLMFLPIKKKKQDRGYHAWWISGLLTGSFHAGS